jgi:flagellar hook-associated protein 1 FlgK
MSGLFGSLTLATRALEAQRVGLDVVGQNMANVNTAGYSRREIDLAEIPPYGGLSAGGGVEVESIRAVRDQLLERRYWQELPDQERSSTMADALAIAQTALGMPGQSIDADLTAFFDAYAHLAQDPTSATARQQVVLQGQSLAASYNDMSTRLDNTSTDADSRVRGAVDEVNSLLADIARLNVAIGSVNGAAADAQHLKDEQGEALRKLSALLDVTIMPRERGGVDVTIANGNPLVIGEITYALGTVSAPVTGLAQIVLNGSDVTATITTGRIGGLLKVRDTLVPGYQASLDEIAYTVVGQVNALHDAGYDANGSDAGLFFDPLAGPTGAARAMAVTSAIAADPSAVAAAGIAAGGDNRTARAIAALRDARVMAGSTATFHDAWGRIVYKAGSDAASAIVDAKSRSEIVRQIETLRDATSGVSLDEEAMSMLKFQRAYEANAKFFTTVNGALDVLMNMIRT